MNRSSLRNTAPCALALAALLVSACSSSSGKVEGWIEKAEGDCALAKTTLLHGLAYVDASMLKHDQPARIEVLLSDVSLAKVDVEAGFNPLFGKEAAARQLYVTYSIPFHGLTSGQFGMKHPSKACMTNTSGSRVAVELTSLTADLVAFKVTPKPPGEGESGPRDALQLVVELPLQWPKNVPPQQREQMAKEFAARLQHERDALALYDGLIKAVAARDIAGIEQRVSLEGWSPFSGLLEELVFGEPGTEEEAKKFLPVVTAFKPAEWLYTREATKAGVDWELKLALCDPADATRRGTVDVKPLEDGRWVATGMGGAEEAANEFGPPPAACTAIGAAPTL